MNKEILKGSTDMLVLSLLKEKDMYGYQMIKELSLKSKSVFEMKEGTLYPILHGLEGKKYIISYWDNSTSKKRKYYSITKEGKKQLSKQVEEWRKFFEGINQTLGGVFCEYKEVFGRCM